MRIGIDARAIYKNLDGIGRYSLNLIRALAKIDKENEYVIFRNSLLMKQLLIPQISEKYALASQRFH